MPTIPQKDADIILRKSAKFPQKGDQCNGSCAFYFCCANGRDFENCRGFQMMNGESEKLLKRGLREHDLEYIENAHGFIQRSIDNGHTEQADVILRDVGQLRDRAFSEPTQNKEGFSAMLEASRGIQNTPTRESEPEIRNTEGFRGMLDSISGKEETDTRTLIRTIDESQFPALCNPMSCPPDFSRHCSANRPQNFGRPCIYRIPTNEQIKHSEPQQRIAKSATLPELLERLSVLEKSVLDAETSPKNDHIIPNRPNFCKTKNPNGLDEE